MPHSVLLFAGLTGISFSLWTTIGFLRFLEEHLKGPVSGVDADWNAGVEALQATILSVVVAAAGAGLFTLVLKLVPGALPAPARMPFAAAGLALVLFMVGVLWLFFGFLGGYVVGRIMRSNTVGYASALAHGAVFGGSLVPSFVESPLYDNFDIVGVFIAAFLLQALSVIASLAGFRNGCSPSRRLRPVQPRKGERISLDEVAVVIAAHNEESSIGTCLANLSRAIPLAQVHVGSDGSKDRTVEIVRGMGANCADIQPNRGKARALEYTLEHFEIYDKYKAVMILDADSEIDPAYFRNALPLFEDPEVAAVAGHATPKWEEHLFPKWFWFIVAYRVRLYFVMQMLLRYGQTWRYTNVSYIVPGFASMYRTNVIRQIDISAPGLVIEDFNMTFELHRRRLGRIAYSPSVICRCDEPHSVRDYWKQIKRWNLGFWQTVWRNGVWPSWFWLSLGIFLVEVGLASIFLATLPFQIILFGVTSDTVLGFSYGEWHSVKLSLSVLLLMFFITDYAMTILTAFLMRRPVLLIYGIGFFPLRFLDAAMFLYSITLSLFVRSDGRWTSPDRAKVEASA